MEIVETLRLIAVATPHNSIMKAVPKIADQLLKNEDLLLRALESNGWKIKVKGKNMIILTK